MSALEIDRELALRTAREILARPEFRSAEQGDSPLGAFLERLFGGGLRAGSSGFAYVLAVALAAALAIWLGLAFASAVRGRSPRARGERAPGPLASAAATSAAEWRARAQRAEAERDPRAALGHYVRALLAALAERGTLEVRDAWTPREILERARPEPRARAWVARLEALQEELDVQSFGAREPSREDVGRWAALCAEVLGP